MASVRNTTLHTTPLYEFFSSESARDNKDIVLSAMEMDGKIRRLVSERLRNDPDVIRAAEQSIAKCNVCFLTNIQSIENTPRDVLLAFSSFIQIHFGRHLLPKVTYEHALEIDSIKDFIRRIFFSLRYSGDFRVSPNKGFVLPKCNKEKDCEVRFYETIGKVFGASFLGIGKIVIGKYFDPVVFEMIQALSSEEVEQIPEDLRSEIPEEISRKLFLIYIKKIMPDLTEEDTAKIFRDEFDAIITSIYFVTSKKEFMNRYFDEVFFGTLAISRGMYDFFTNKSTWEYTRAFSKEYFQRRVEGLE